MVAGAPGWATLDLDDTDEEGPNPACIRALACGGLAANRGGEADDLARAIPKPVGAAHPNVCEVVEAGLAK